MRQPRIKADPSEPFAFYHCISRVVNRDRVLKPHHKELFVRLMARYARFSGIQILTYCILDNHFHLLARVPRRPDPTPPDDELLAMIGALYGRQRRGELRAQLRELRREGHHESARSLLAPYTRRMWDISQFMKGLKQVFTQAFNRDVGRSGTLWEERFRSVLLEGPGPTVALVAAYIDLNPFRAGISNDPSGYRWSGFAAACAGVQSAREGIRLALDTAGEPNEGRTALEEYRLRLYLAGAPRDADTEGAERRSLSAEAVEQVWKTGGKLTMGDLLRCRTRYFSDSAVLGSKSFVNAFFVAQRWRFGPKRRDGARPLRGVRDPSIHSLRDLRVAVYGTRPP